MESASAHDMCPQLTHLYRISRGSIGALQWLQCSSDVGLYCLLSVLLQFLHFAGVSLSPSLLSGRHLTGPFFNLSYPDFADLQMFTKFSKMFDPNSVSFTSGWNWRPNLSNSPFCIAWTLQDSLSAITVKPGGGVVTSSLWLSQTVW
ncbi:MAG: hypothetical protein Ct9H90mP24_7810 [Methanobacteriota archaeon]|nr:MAG: hypothetical protein Ct9H90mP24_7810 [Euryarchaeota archaeon]